MLLWLLVLLLSLLLLLLPVLVRFVIYEGLPKALVGKASDARNPVIQQVFETTGIRNFEFSYVFVS